LSFLCFKKNRIGFIILQHLVQMRAIVTIFQTNPLAMI